MGVLLDYIYGNVTDFSVFAPLGRRTANATGTPPEIEPGTEPPTPTATDATPAMTG